MSDNSPKIGLPYILASQTQKHVTMNESLNIIDSLIMLCVINRTLATAPLSPSEGDKYIVAPSPTGAWAGRTGQIAAFLNAGWQFFAPQTGFIAHIQAEAVFVVFDGTSWQYIGTALGEIQNQKLIGLGTTADTNNPLSAKINKALFSAKYASEAGTGDLQYVFNKEATTNKISLLFQNNWSGRAEIGLIGNDNLTFKVSNNGTAWKESIAIDSANGRAAINYGADFAPQSDGSNELLRYNGARFLHAKKPTGTDGFNLFLGESSGNLTMTGSGTQASRNVGLGQFALAGLSTGFNNCAIGASAAANLSTGDNNTCVGYNALKYKIDGSDNTTYSNCSGLGADTKVSGSNQVQLGNAATTVYAYGAVQNRSDIRDKTCVRDTVLGLDFICALRPVDFKWDYRENHSQRAKDRPPQNKRYHHGFIAQEVEKTIADLKIDFGGYQDHLKSGGEDVKSLGYTEFIAPMIKAIQELSRKIDRLEK
jgi:hypothetical protein